MKTSRDRDILLGLEHGFQHHPRSHRLAMRAAQAFMSGYAGAVTVEECERVLAMRVGDVLSSAPLNRRGEPRPPDWYPGYWKAKRAWEAANPGVPFLPAKKQRKP